MNIEALERDLPPAMLLLGPDASPMVSAAYRAAVKTHLVLVADIRLRRHLSAGDSRGIVQFAQTAPFGPFKLVIAQLDGASAQAQNILLKVLEEPPLLDSGEPAIRFILAAAQRPLPTIVSRCQVVIVPAAGEPAVRDERVVRQVSAALKAAEAGQLVALDKALEGWGEEQHAVLSLLLAEAAARPPLQPGDGRNEPIGPGTARKLLGALGRFSGANPRLAAHAALVTVLVP